MPGGERKIMGTPLGGHLRHASGDGEGEWLAVGRAGDAGERFVRWLGKSGGGPCTLHAFTQASNGRRTGRLSANVAPIGNRLYRGLAIR